MSNRGRPLPVTIRVAIRERRVHETVRRLAESLGISKTTVQKYSQQVWYKTIERKKGLG